MWVHLHIDQKHNAKGVRLAVRAALEQSHGPERICVTRGPGAPVVPIESDRLIVLEEERPSRIAGLEAALGQAQEAGAQWLMPCLIETALTQHALASFTAHIFGLSNRPTPEIIYGDTREQPKGPFGAAHRRYWLKPQWDPRMILSQDYVTAGCVLAVDQAASVLRASASPKPHSLYELVLKASEAGAVEHCPRVVAQTPMHAWCEPDPERIAIVAAHVADRAIVSPGPFGTARVQFGLPDTLPHVSVIIATRDRVDLLRTCVEGVLHSTDYPALDVTIADNDSVEPETLAYMDEVSADPRVQIVRWPYPFNYSAINNFAARHAKGEYLCLLNNDIEVIAPDWLTEMMREAVQPGVGAVGARLLYPDQSIQHAGVAIGIGNAAGHAHRGLPEGEPGYFAQAQIARGASAVTAACLVVAKKHFDAVGGLDEESLAVAYNDVDLCLKLRALGLTNIYTPLATLIHHESKSRGLDFAPEHLERYMLELGVFQDRWDTRKAVDPWHHPLLARGKELYSIH